MNVGDDGHRRARHNLCKTFCGFYFVACATDNVTTCRSQRIDLLEGSFNICCFRNGHGLDADRRPATYCHFAYLNLLRLAALETHDYQCATTRRAV